LSPRLFLKSSFGLQTGAERRLRTRPEG
jgi:hypothetical protein